MLKFLREIAIVFFLFLSSIKSFSLNSNDSVKIINKDSGYYLQYKFQGINKEIQLPYPFVDSAIVIDDILYKKGNLLQKKSIVNIGHVMLITVADFDFSTKAALFVIDKSNNKIVTIENRKNLYLETGLPYFIFSNSTLVISNTLTFINSTNETDYVYYYKVSGFNLKLTRLQKKRFRENELNDKNIININYINALFR
jgi:hypothetical protein